MHRRGQWSLSCRSGQSPDSCSTCWCRDTGQGESGASFVGEVEEDAEMVEEDTKMAGEDVVFTWTHFFLLTVFVAVCTMTLLLVVKGFFVGLDPIAVDPRKIMDHPCRFENKKVADLANIAMSKRLKMLDVSGT
mmetsp:Transcript_59752/g.96777  ORF Transcript_59752/g.96777 Transcript_59752/m.96777 type:complete len:134 (+) Transcript_59752:356-757(+)